MTAIEFNNISKQYRLGLVSTRTLSHDLNRWWTMNVRGKDDPYLKIGDTNDRSTKGESDYVWALRDIDFKVEQGDVLGINGKNGAGKSTLLKILSKVTTPTTGTIKARGRIASLLEVGTGFHPEMTGRENIYMNGAIMGMTKAEISRKLDEIVDFSGVERYLDTPVKRYSSGMTVRLGFAIAAHLDPEILVVDEVLAVGDAEFQKKAIGKMQDVSKGDGRTVLFVSHNMASIQMLCTKCTLLSNGSVEKIGNTSDIISYYLRSQKGINDYLRSGTKAITIEDFNINRDSLELSEDLKICLTIKANYDIDFADISFDIKDDDYKNIAHISNYDDSFEIKNLKKGSIRDIECTIRNINLAPGNYNADIWIGTPYDHYDYIKECISFYVQQGGKLIKRTVPYDAYSKVVLASKWQYV